MCPPPDAFDGLEAEAGALEGQLDEALLNISSDASRKTLMVARDALSKLYGAAEQLTLKVDGCGGGGGGDAAARRKALVERCEALSEACVEGRERRLASALASAADKQRSAGNELFAKGDHADASERYAAALELTPDDARLYLNRGLCWQSLKEWAKAAADAKAAVKLDCGNAKAHFHLTRSLVALGEVEAAAVALGNAPAELVESSKSLAEMKHSTIPEAAKKQANASFVAKDYEAALPLYTLAVDLTAGKAHLYLSNRSACYQALGKWAKAAEDGRAVVALEPSFPKGHLHLARSLKQLERADAAVEACEFGLEHVADKDATALKELLASLKPRGAAPKAPCATAKALRDAGAALYKRGAYKEALTQYTKCLSTSDDERDAVYANRAACWLMVNDPDRAAKDCADAEAVIAKRLDDDEARDALPGGERDRLTTSRSKVASRRCTALCRLGRLDEAAAVAERAFEATGDAGLKKKRSEAGQYLELRGAGDEAVGRGEFSRGKRCFLKLRDECGVTDDPLLRLALAKCHVRLKEYDDGSREAMQALASKRLRGQDLVEAHTTRADALVAVGDRDKAAAHVSACLQMDPDDDALKTKLKKLRRGTKDAERVKGDVEAAINKGDYDAAVKAATEGIGIDEDDKKLLASMHVRRAKAYQLLALKAKRQPTGDEKNASLKACWRKCHSDASAALYHASPGSKSAFLLGAEALQGLGRYQDAINLLEQCLEAIPETKQDRAVVGKYKEAQFLLKKANRPNLYAEVGPDLDENSSEQEMKKAYKKAALKWHPDRFSTKSDEEKSKAEVQFKKINDAYEFLTDPQRKKLWDQGHDREEVEQKIEMAKQQAAQGGMRGGFPGGGFPGGFPGGFHHH